YGQHHKRHPEFIRQAIHMLANIHHCFATEDTRRIGGLKFFHGSVIMNHFKIREEDPSLEPASQAAVVVDCPAYNNARQPNPQRTVASKMLDTAEAAHQRLLNDILGVARIARRSDRDLKQNRTVLPSSLFKINIFRSNSYGLHPPVSVVMTALTKGEFELFLSRFDGFQIVQFFLNSCNFFCLSG